MTSYISAWYSGGNVVHSYGRLIPHEFPIIDIEQISGPDGLGRIICTVSSGTAEFFTPVEGLENDSDGSDSAESQPGGFDGGGVTETRNGTTATLVVDPSVTIFSNKEGYCADQNTNFFYLFINVAGADMLTIET